MLFTAYLGLALKKLNLTQQVRQASITIKCYNTKNQHKKLEKQSLY